MATTKKGGKRTASSKSAGKANTKRNTSKKQNKEIESFTNEVLMLIMLALAIILMVSNFGVGGFVGDAISSFFFGIFGLLAYVFPLILFIGFAFFMSNKRNPLAYKKIISGLFFYIFLCALVQLLTEGYMDTAAVFEFYAASAKYHSGGGVVGGLLCKLFAMAFGVAGAYILVILGMIISLIFLTQRSFLGFFHKIFRKIGREVQSFSQKREETRPEREARARQRAMERKIRAEERYLEKEQQAGQKPTRVSHHTAKNGEDGQFLEGTKLSVPAKEFVETEKQDKDFNTSRKTEDFVELKPENAEYKEPKEMDFEIHRSEEEVLDLDDIGEEMPPKSSQNSRSSKEEIESGVENIKKEITTAAAPKQKYQFPALSMLKAGKKGASGDSDEYLRETAKKLQTTLHNFGVEVTVTNVSCGPTVTRYELQPEQGVKVSKIVNLTDDIKLNLATSDIRIEAPIPGKAAVGIEVPNKENSAVMLRDLLQSGEFQNAKSKLAFAAGKDIAGKPVVADIAKMPHLLIAGATGSGKSVCINTLIMSILYKATPDEVKLIMIDPKVVELSVYNGIPHLLIPVVTDPKKAAGALNWAVAEMTDRYNTFAEYNVRNLEDYNRKLDEMTFGEGEKVPEKMPQIVIIVDELADLMMVAPGEVEDAICRLAQLARAAGIHLVIATQRPSVNVITGLIKANMPSRIAFAVSSGVDSRTILDMNGAEKLLGKGDMLFYPQGYQKPARLQGAFVSDQEVSAVVSFLANKNPEGSYNQEIEQKINTAGFTNGAASASADDRDMYFIDAAKFIIEKDKASIGLLQRTFKIGFNRAARIMDQLFSAGVVGPEEGTKPRKILMSMEEFEKYIEESL
ncbi:MAG: DNA translocase FtsK [Eubacteriales bacterium]|nr:DNA translocase FtsK [Eubacteriales bacterium]